MYGHWIATSIPPGSPFHVRAGRLTRSVTTSHAGVDAQDSFGGATGMAPAPKVPLHDAVEATRRNANVPRSSARAATGESPTTATTHAHTPNPRRTASRCIRAAGRGANVNRQAVTAPGCTASG